MHASKSAPGESNVAIISDEPEFVRVLMGRWRSERVTPAFAVFPGGVSVDAVGDCELIVAGGLSLESLLQVLKAQDTSLRSLICIVGPDEYMHVRELFPQALLLHRDEFWADNTVLLGGECVRRRHAILRAQRAEESALISQRYAGLGKYMIETRHNMNNALTSVLGNAELLLLGAENLSSSARDQLETIRNMSLRIHEIMRRFWSLEVEMQVTQHRSSDSETNTRGLAATNF